MPYFPRLLPPLDTGPTGLALLAAATQAEALAAIGAAANSELVGQVAFFAMSLPPSGWLNANGALLSRTTYANLFAAIGTTFGEGDGSTTFALPDLRGEFLRGWDDGRGTDTGRLIGTAQSHAIQTHNHNLQYFSGTFSNCGNTSNFVRNATNDSGTLICTVSGTITSMSNPVGANTAAETRPRNIALLACIRY